MFQFASGRRSSGNLIPLTVHDEAHDRKACGQAAQGSLNSGIQLIKQPCSRCVANASAFTATAGAPLLHSQTNIELAVSPTRDTLYQVLMAPIWIFEHWETDSR